MEDDDDTAASLLYCDEDPLLVSTPPRPAAAAAADGGGGVMPPLPEPVAAAAEAEGEEEEEEVVALLEHMMGRQGCYAPSRGYLDHLQLHDEQGAAAAAAAAGVAAARSRGVHYIVYAVGRLGLAAATAFNAVNYLDRFLSINCHLMWEEAWMVELVSVACLSIACKLDEVNIPSLHDLQLEEVLGHSFRPATVRDMEVTLLKALQWRLACVTPYSFLQLLLRHTTTAATTTAARRATRLLVRSLAEPSLLLRFDPSVVAASALRLCVNHQQQDHQLHSDDIVRRLVRPHCCPTEDYYRAADECLRMMQAIHAASCSLDYFNDTSEQQQQCSPVSAVFPLQTHNPVIINRRSVISRRRRCLFDGSSTPSPPQQGTTQDDDDGGGGGNETPN